MVGRNGTKLLDTDTDSIVFATTPDIFTSYEKEFIWHNKKSFGAMELEGDKPYPSDTNTFDSFICIDPKKYALGCKDGYCWQANGLLVKANASRDIEQMFKDVLDGDIVEHDYGAWETRDFIPSHADEGSTKDMRLITTKGRVENGKISWWKIKQNLKNM